MCVLQRQACRWAYMTRCDPSELQRWTELRDAGRDTPVSPDGSTARPCCWSRRKGARGEVEGGGETGGGRGVGGAGRGGKREKRERWRRKEEGREEGEMEKEKGGGQGTLGTDSTPVSKSDLDRKSVV